jgi:hypothetical protein
MATAPSANDLTRQQLDELDALLQRMLSLPVNPPEAASPNPPAPAANRYNEIQGPAFAAAPRLAPPPMPAAELPRPRLPEPAPLPVPAARPPVAQVPAPEPTLPITDWNAVTTTPPADRRAAPLPFASAAAYAMPAVAPVPPPRGESVPAALWPLVAVNWSVDTLLGFFGPPGRFLRSALGKNLLGLIGIALLAYTTAHIASEQGWLELPFPLPWPPR